MKSRSGTALYFLLTVLATASTVYYIAGAIALREEFFHASRYVNPPFGFRDDGQTLSSVRKEAQIAGLSAGDLLLTLNAISYTGEDQLHKLLQHTRPGQSLAVSVSTASGGVRNARICLTPRSGPDFSLGSMIAFLIPVLGVPLLGLLIGYWIVAGRPYDLNAWLVMALLAFPETAYGNLDFSFWPSPWYLLLGVWNGLVQIFVFPALLWFGFLFPERWRLDLRFPWLKHAVLACTGCVFAFELASYAGQYFAVKSLRPFMALQFWSDRVSSGIKVLCILLFLAALFDKLRCASTADARRRLRVLAFGSGLSLGPLLIISAVVPLFGIDPHHGNWFIAMIPFVALFPVTLAYVLVVQRAMDVRILLRMGTKYLLARATLVTLEVVIVVFVVLQFIVPRLARNEHPLLNLALVAICVAALFQIFILRDSISQRLQHWLDRRFFREAYNSELILSGLSEQVCQITDKGALLDTVLRRISEVLHVAELAAMLRGSAVFSLQYAMGMNTALLRSLTLGEDSATIQHLLRTMQPATIYGDRPEEWFAEADEEEKALLRQMRAELLLPMRGRAGLIGLIALGPKRSEEPYTPTDLRMLQSVAAQTGLTLEVAELAQNLAEQAAQRERMSREIEIAREVQQRLFPQSIPEIAGLTLAGMCRPAFEVGGDYYDLVALESGLLGLAIGDVSGKGISAALIMASLRASLRSLLLDEPGDLAKMVEKINRLVYEASSSSRYATFFFATYNPPTRELRYVNAGHNAPALVCGTTTDLQRLDTCGTVVGMLPVTSYEERSVLLKPGDLLIAYTDGISEAMTIEDEEWGEERMLASVCLAPSASASEVLDKLFCATDAFTAGAEQHDDMTLLIMKIDAEASKHPTH